MNPFFSIIIPTFNSGNCIKGALQSVCQQRFTNYEIIIVDGLSSDDTLEKVNVFYNKYGSERIIVKSEKDDGIYDAMNKGINMARGEFVYFMGSDDVLFSDMVLGDIYNISATNIAADIIYGNVVRVDSKLNSHLYETTYSLTNIRFIDLILVYCKLGINHQSFFARKKTLLQLFKTRFKIAADFNWIIESINNRYRFKHVNITIAKYNTTGVSSNLKDLFHDLTEIIGFHYGSFMKLIFYFGRKWRWNIT